MQYGLGLLKDSGVYQGSAAVRGFRQSCVKVLRVARQVKFGIEFQDDGLKI